MIFDGKRFAEKRIEAILRLPVEKRQKKLAVLLDPLNASGVKYVALKQRLAKRIGVQFEVIQKSSNENLNNNEDLITKLNTDKNVDGIMIQLPYPDSDQLIPLIVPNKDVDGLREDSPYMMATVKAVLIIMNTALQNLKSKIENLNNIQTQISICVIGSSGEVGSRVVAKLHQMEEFKVFGMDSQNFDPEKMKLSDVIISCAGVQGAFGADLIKTGVIVIDIGFPKGDFDLEVFKKASFYTPVPGGVGPVTVVALFENLVNLRA